MFMYCMLNFLLNKINIHLKYEVSKYDSVVKKLLKLKLRNRENKKRIRALTSQNNLFKDILRGLKRNELMMLHSNVEKLASLIDEFQPLRNIFIS